MLIVCVTFKIKPGDTENFLPLMLENAARSTELEPECHQFDVSQAIDDPNTVFLYEVYTNSQAFDYHLSLPHFEEFSIAVEAMVEAKTVETYSRLEA